MAYVLFDYTPGRIEVRFNHEPEFDFLNLNIRLIGDITTTTECDEQGGKTEAVDHQKDTVDFFVEMSSVWCPFKDFIRFLKAITLEVQECTFDWDAEGSDGRMHWQRRFIQDTGFLSVEWASSKEKFSHRMMLNTRQAVRMLYSAFRAFADSPEYDPLRYEKLTYGQGFALMLSDASLDDLAAKLVQMNADDAKMVLQRIWNKIYDRHMQGPNLSFPIAYFLDTTEPVDSSGVHKWLDPDWNSWDEERRKSEVEALFAWERIGWFGDNLREMRSTMIEDWLALPEPKPTTKDGLNS